ncbi:MAG: hypothetical protein ABIJ95_07110 [Pseudomonadota bacterium]
MGGKLDRIGSIIQAFLAAAAKSMRVAQDRWTDKGGTRSKHMRTGIMRSPQSKRIANGRRRRDIAYESRRRNRGTA